MNSVLANGHYFGRCICFLHQEYRQKGSDPAGLVRDTAVPTTGLDVSKGPN
jgi:hypothetical protein